MPVLIVNTAALSRHLHSMVIFAWSCDRPLKGGFIVYWHFHDIQNLQKPRDTLLLPMHSSIFPLFLSVFPSKGWTDILMYRKNCQRDVPHLENTSFVMTYPP